MSEKPLRTRVGPGGSRSTRMGVVSMKVASEAFSVRNVTEGTRET